MPERTRRSSDRAIAPRSAEPGPNPLRVRRAAPRPAVLVLHGFKGFKDWGMFPPLAERLALAGFSAVSPNFSGSGVDDAGLSTIVQPVASAWAAIASVERWPLEQRTLWRATGRSEVRNARTGQVLPLYTDVLDDIERNAAALDIEAAAGRIAIPWLLIHGTNDESVGFSEAELLKGASPGKTSRLMPVEGGGHTFGATHPWRSGTPQVDTVFDATIEWLATHLS